MDLIHREFSDWLAKKYGWTFSYFYRICGETRRTEIWNEFLRERDNKK